MDAPAVPISEASHRKLQELAGRSGRPVAEVLERAIDAYHREQFWEAVNAGYAALRADPRAWAEEEAERRLWDATLADGLDPTERWSDDGRPLPPDEPGRPT